MASGVTRLRLRTLLATMPNADGSRTRAEGFLLPWQGPYSRDLAMGVGDRPQDGVSDNEQEHRQLSVTIRDVARAANVSISTVSHVLSGKRPTSGQTRRRVEDVVARLGYRPNRVAQSLVWRRPFALGLIIPDITNPYFPAFARGAEDCVRDRGYTLVLGNSPMPHMPTVSADNRQGGRLAAEHLLGLDHRAFGIISALPLDDGMAD